MLALVRGPAIARTASTGSGGPAIIRRVSLVGSTATVRSRTLVSCAASPHRLCSALLTPTIPRDTAPASTAANSIAAVADSQTVPTRTTATNGHGAASTGTAAAVSTLRLASILSLALGTAFAGLLRTAATATVTRGTDLAGLALTLNASPARLAAPLRMTTATAAGLAGLRHARLHAATSLARRLGSRLLLEHLLARLLAWQLVGRLAIGIGHESVRAAVNALGAWEVRHELAHEGLDVSQVEIFHLSHKFENLYVSGNVSGGMFAYTYPNLFTGLAGGRTLTWSYLIAKQIAAL